MGINLQWLIHRLKLQVAMNNAKSLLIMQTLQVGLFCHNSIIIMKQMLCVLFLSFFFLLVTSQDCPLPNSTEIVAALDDLLVFADGSITYSPSLMGDIKYVCQAQGERMGTYKTVSIIATFTPNPGDPSRTNIFQLMCASGVWYADTTGTPVTPDPSVINATTRTDCAQCRHSWGPDRCRGCHDDCNTGLMRCTSPFSDDCCLVFSVNGDCSTDCSSSGMYYNATASTNYTCTCNLSCPAGYSPDTNCTKCLFDNICEMVPSPCMNGGGCMLLSSPESYTCNCTGTGYQGVNCSVPIVQATSSSHFSTSTAPSSSIKITSTSTSHMSSSAPPLVPSPSPSPSSCNVNNCGDCGNDIDCCDQCIDGYARNGCSCASTSDPFDFTIIIIIIIIVFVLLLLILMGSVTAVIVYNVFSSKKRKILPLKKV